MKKLLTLLFFLMIASLAFGGEIPGNRNIPGPVTITGTTSEIDSVAGQPLILQGNNNQPVYIEYDGIGSTRTPLSPGLELLNTTPATSEGTIQNSPSLIFSSRAFYNGNDNEMLFGMFGRSDAANTTTLLNFASKRGPSDWVNSYAKISPTHFLVEINRAESLIKGLELSCPGSASSSEDGYSPCLTFKGTGWKTASTAGSQNMSCSFFLAPESGVTNPTGRLKLSYGTNTTFPVEANELIAFEWGDRLGMVLNSPNTSEYVFDYSKAKTVKPQIYTQATEPDIANNSTAYWKDSDDSKFYMILDVEGTQKKVELT